ncbi:MAG: hypothetical protein ACLQNE_22460 [Thermoguttaceae bacterium]|jgi:hypothetical protein
MDRRQFFEWLSGTTGIVALGGFVFGRAAYARGELRKKFTNEAMTELIPKAHQEVLSLPERAQQEISTWFHGPCLNSAEFVYDICSPAFTERLASCDTPHLREQCFVNAFHSKVVSSEEILAQVRLIAKTVGSELDRNWADACSRISKQWDINLKPHGTSVAADFAARMEPAIRQSLDETVRQAKTATPPTNQSDSLLTIGEAVLLGMEVIWFPSGIVSPAFLILALRPFISYVVDLLTGRTAGQIRQYQGEISGRIATLGDRIGGEFYETIKSQVVALHAWQEKALVQEAGAKALETIGWV